MPRARTVGETSPKKELDMTDPRHLLLVGTGPGLGAAIARRFAREGYRLTLVARSEETIATIAQEERDAWREEYRFEGAGAPAVASS
jgi:NAD(P)-dependent dehydrogenase (short-subunit alcohol dehydrogenase family)